MPPSSSRFRVAEVVALFGCGVLAGIALGGLMNLINVRISPDYFAAFFHYSYHFISAGPTEITVLDWTLSDAYHDSFDRGMWEGLVLGSVISTLFTAYVFMVSAASCPFAVSVRCLSKMVVCVALFSLIGGLNGAILSFLPDAWLPYSSSISPPLDRVRWFWVEGSIWGSYFGALASLFYGCISFKLKWRKIKSINTTLPPKPHPAP